MIVFMIEEHVLADFGGGEDHGLRDRHVLRLFVGSGGRGAVGFLLEDSVRDDAVDGG